MFIILLYRIVAFKLKKKIKLFTKYKVFLEFAYDSYITRKKTQKAIDDNFMK